jgi:hypothetical protein
MDKQCSLCHSPLGSKNKTGRCRPCNSKLWAREHRDYMYSKRFEWDNKNPHKRKEYNSKNYLKHKHKQIARKKFRYNNDPVFKLRHIIRNRLNCAIKRNYKSGSAIKSLGCSVEFLKKHIEALFEPGMTWQNHGQWHIDHIVPLNHFDLTDSLQLQKACHYTNLQPLWKCDNIKKGANYEQ